jgi:hypothetical protein
MEPWIGRLTGSGERGGDWTTLRMMPSNTVRPFLPIFNGRCGAVRTTKMEGLDPASWSRWSPYKRMGTGIELMSTGSLLTIVGLIVILLLLIIVFKT